MGPAEGSVAMTMVPLNQINEFIQHVALNPDTSVPITAVFCTSRKQSTVACSTTVFFFILLRLCRSDVTCSMLRGKNKALFESTKNGEGRPVYTNNLA